MKYAIYDKAAAGYLTKMEFEVGHSEHTQFECGYNEYIIEARLLDTPKEAADTIARIESDTFMEKGPFVIHSFDDTLKDQYIISEAGEPTKVVDNITVDLNGAISIKYGTMAFHWSATSLVYAVNRMFKLQNSLNPNVYTSWYDTFDIYKVITVIDEKSCTHYQFIKVTEKGLSEYSKEEIDPLNKRIEELEKSNYDLGEQVTARGAVANRLQEENNKLEAKVESIKKEAQHWKTLYENADADLMSKTACNDLKDTLKAIYHNLGLEHIYMENFLTAKDEICSIINHVITIMESRELNQKVAFSSAEEMTKVKDIAEKIIDICDSNDDFTVQLYKFSKLYATIDNISKTTNSSLMMAFNKFLALMSTANKSLDKILGDNIDMMIKWRSESEKLRKDLENQKELNDANKATIARMVVEKRTMSNELSDAVDALESTRKVLTTVTDERDKALEQKEFYKRQANSVYGMTMPCRCNGKQGLRDMLYDVKTGMKVLVDKEKYDSLVECVNNINVTYEILKCTDLTINKPLWFDGVITRIKNLTE